MNALPGKQVKRNGRLAQTWKRHWQVTPETTKDPACDPPPRWDGECRRGL